MKKLKLAVFDVDRTLVRGTSCEIQLIRFLRSKGMFPSSNYGRALVWIFRHGREGFHKAVLQNKGFLIGLDAERIKCLMPEFYSERIERILSGRALEWLEKLKQNGYRILLVSGTLDFILEYLAERLGAHEGLGSCMEIKDGRFTGRMLGLFPYWHGKVAALQAHFKGLEVDYARSFCFADSWADIPLLERFGHPIAMNPGRTLHWVALKRGWVIMKG